MKKSLPAVLAVLFGIFLMVTLLLCIVRTDLQDASLMGLIDSSLGVAGKIAGKKSIVPALIKFGLSTAAFISFIALTTILGAVIIIIQKKLTSWHKKIAFPLIVDGAILLAASPTAALLYKAKVPKLVQGMFKNLYTESQTLILICGGGSLVAGIALIAITHVLSKKK